MKRALLSSIIIIGIICTSSGCQSGQSSTQQTPTESAVTTRVKDEDSTVITTTSPDISKVENNSSAIKDDSINSTVTVKAETSTTTETTKKQEAKDTTEALTSEVITTVEESTTTNVIKTATDMLYTIELTSGPRTGRYSGDVNVEGVPHGKGKFTSRNTEDVIWFYEGDFADGYFNGEGVRSWEDGRREEGVYENNHLNGLGKHFLDEELLYEGMYVDGIRSGGNGKLFSGDEVVFEGLFENGLPEESAFKEQCKEVTSEHIARRPDYYKRRPVKITGKILQVVNLSDIEVDYRIGTGDGYKEIFYVAYDRSEGETRELEGDVVTVWGSCRGLITYNTNLGGRNTVPGIMVYYLENHTIEKTP